MALPATDNFNRAGPALGANWATLTSQNAFVIDSSTKVIGGTGSNENCSYWSADAFNASHYAQCKIAANAIYASTDGGPAICCQSGSESLIMLDYGEVVDTFRIYKCVTGTFTQVGSDISHTYSAAETYRIESTGVGTSGTITARYNGTSMGTATHPAAPTGGSAGMFQYFYSGKTSYYDDWEGGDVGTPAAGSILRQMIMNN